VPRHRTWRFARSAWLAALLVCGCVAERPAATPRDALSAYARAVRDGRLQDAYALLSEDAKKDLPYEAFSRMVGENPQAMQPLADELTRPSGVPAVTATVTTPDGNALLLVLEKGRWRIDPSAIDLYSQVEPRAAIASFVRAFDNRRYDILMRFVPDDKREGLDPAALRRAWEGEQKSEMRQIVGALDAALPTARVEQIGDRATMAYGAAGTVELVREHGLWKIEDIVR
jgi:hypothetical protein